MICVVLLAAYAAGAGFLAPALLGRDWSVHAPRLAIGVWLALSASFITAVLLGALAMAVRFPLSWHIAAAGGLRWAGYPAPSVPAAAAAGTLGAG